MECKTTTFPLKLLLRNKLNTGEGKAPVCNALLIQVYRLVFQWSISDRGNHTNEMITNTNEI